MQPFAYEKPATIEAATALLAQPGARALAGGTDLIPQVREGRRTIDAVVDIKHIPELTRIARQADGGWSIGAAASIAALGRCAAFAADHPGLLASARLIGSLQIQSRATLGGNLANGAPSADAVPLLLALDAKVMIAGPAAIRVCPVEAVLLGPGKTSLAPGELLVALQLPARQPSTAAHYLRFTPRREMDIAIAGSGVALALGPSGEIASARIVLSSVAPVPLRATAAETILTGQRPQASCLAEAARLSAAAATPISDTRGSAAYRRHLVAVLTRRALEACVAEIASKGAQP